jgi:hypothetical protein
VALPSYKIKDKSKKAVMVFRFKAALLIHIYALSLATLVGLETSNSLGDKVMNLLHSL